MKKKEVSNEHLYNYLLEHYCTNEVTQQQVADYFGMSLGGIKNFIYRHKITKKKVYENKKTMMIKYYQQGLSTSEIATLTGSTRQYVYYVLNNNKLN